MRASQRCDALVRQAIAVWLVLLAGAVAAALGVAEAASVVIAAAVVEATLGWALTVARDLRRERVLELIVDGREGLPLDAVERECRRLRDPREREALAAALEELRDEAQRPVPGVAPIYQRSLVRTLSSELAEIATLLRRSEPRLPGVALTVRLLRDGSSPLYGRDARLLSDALHRVRWLLTAK